MLLQTTEANRAFVFATPNMLNAERTSYAWPQHGTKVFAMNRLPNKNMPLNQPMQQLRMSQSFESIN